MFRFMESHQGQFSVRRIARCGRIKILCLVEAGCEPAGAEQ